MCLGRIVFRNSSLAETIALSIEFSRLADIYNITSTEFFIAEHIKNIIVADTS